MPLHLRPCALSLSLLLCAPACVNSVTTPASASQPLDAGLHAELLAFEVRERGSRLPPSAEPSAAFVRFVGGDEALARGVLDGLRDSAYMLGRARCSEGDPEASVELLARTEDFVLYAALLALIYEFERHELTTSTQALAVLHRLAERMDSTDTLFPERELLTPEEVAVTRGRRTQQAPEPTRERLFLVYVEELFESSTSNREFALKKQRIAERIEALSAAISTLYLRDRSEDAQLCEAVEVLAAATQDAWLWASEAVSVARVSDADADAYELAVELALTNVGPASGLAVLPRAVLRCDDGRGGALRVELEPTALREGGLSDNHVAPGYTLTRSLGGRSELAPAGMCSLELELWAGAEVQPFVLELGASPSPGS